MPRQSETEQVLEALAQVGQRMMDAAEAMERLSVRIEANTAAAESLADAVAANNERLDVICEALTAKPKSDIAEALRAIRAGVETTQGSVGLVQATANAILGQTTDIHGVVCGPRAPRG